MVGAHLTTRTIDGILTYHSDSTVFARTACRGELARRGDDDLPLDFEDESTFRMPPGMRLCVDQMCILPGPSLISLNATVNSLLLTMIACNAKRRL
jgi:hypothetical protein